MATSILYKTLHKLFTSSLENHIVEIKIASKQIKDKGLWKLLAINY